MEQGKNSFDLTELNKLESYLKENGYAYKRTDSYIDEHECLEFHQLVVFDDASYNVRLWDAIISYGSYGNYDGLLEIMIEGIHDVKGYLTAEDVIKMLPSMR